jgi:CheY-like chemotaxis protein
MMLVVVPDLLFGSKIREAARAAGVDLRFARTPDEILRHAREAAPSLAVFDLDNRATDPIAAIQALKRDPTLAGIRIVGFVSHVRADLVSAARAAGADEVLARSAFVAQLGDILRR